MNPFNVGRYAIAFLYIYFGVLKLVGLSPASSLAQQLVEKTVGMQYYDPLMIGLGLFEIFIGVLFLSFALRWIGYQAFYLHMMIVSLPVLLIPIAAFSAPFVPTLEGQYILKNVALIALVYYIRYYDGRSHG